MNLNLLDKTDLFSLESKIDKILHILEDKSIASNQKWMRSTDVKDMLHVSDATLKNYRDTGQIKFSKVGGTYFYLFSDIYELLHHAKQIVGEKTNGGRNEQSK